MFGPWFGIRLHVWRRFIFHVFRSDVNFIDNRINFCNFQMNNERARFQTNFHRRPQPHKHKYIYTSHDDVIRWKHLPRYWPFVWGIHRSQRTVMRSFDVSLICVRIPGWLDNHDAGDLRRHCAHYDVTVIIFHVQLRDREQTTHNKLETKETNTQINSTLSRRHSNDYKVRYVFSLISTGFPDFMWHFRTVLFKMIDGISWNLAVLRVLTWWQAYGITVEWTYNNRDKIEILYDVARSMAWYDTIRVF